MGLKLTSAFWENKDSFIYNIERNQMSTGKMSV